MINPIEKRNRQPAIPKNISSYLTLDQEMALMNLGKFGWGLKFIRRPLFQEPTIVLMNMDNHYGISVLEKDGRINTNPQLALRA